ncbi:MAG TPA: SagB/ThcOx family dehydrogenase [Chloroflexota bacterium]|jgi:SagB-type dehydrogenase family enzyme
MTDSNRDTSAALVFHAATKYVSLRDPNGQPKYGMGTPPNLEPVIWEEDWSLDPRTYKLYTDLPPIELPTTFAPSQLRALEAISRTGAEHDQNTSSPDRTALARLARLSNGLIKHQRVTRTRGVVQFRAAAATGARYHLELYVVCAQLPDLDAGVYHYAAHDHSLRQLRTGDVRGVLVEASGREPSLAEAPVIVVLTSTFWRNAFRYKARAYRHTFWDAGTLLANALAVAASLELPTNLVLGFADRAVNHLLGVDGEREASVVLCAVGRGARAPAAVTDLPDIAHPTEPLSPAEVTFADIPRMHAASSLASGEAAAAWRGNPVRRAMAPPNQSPIPLTPRSDEWIPTAPIEDVILARRSTRFYDSQQPLSFELFSTILDRSVRGVATDCLADGALPLHDGYLIVNAVEGLAPGTYLHRAHEGSIELLRAGDFRTQAGHLAFDQEYAGDAHVDSYYLADLDPVLEHYGNRGYRLAQLQAALYAGRVHLASHALGLGAVGLTSFDDEVIDFFSPHAAGASYLFVTAFGKRRRRPD